MGKITVTVSDRVIFVRGSREDLEDIIDELRKLVEITVEYSGRCG